MNRRRFLGLAAVAPLAALGTRVPEPAPSFEDAHAAGFQDGLAAAENAALASEAERIQALVDMAMERPERYPELMARVRELSGRDAYPMMSPSGSFNTSDRMMLTGAGYRLEQDISVWFNGTEHRIPVYSEVDA